MSLTDEQRNAVRCDDDLMLTACPGSGKTRVIISKLSRVIEEVRDTPRAVACITYTNAAVQEIETRLRHHIQPGDDTYYDICTIHSFCLNHIFRPFCHLINGYKQGFKVLTPESPEFEEHVKAVCAQSNRYNLTFKDYEDFTQLRVSLEGKPVGAGIERGALTPAAASAYWKRIREAGFVDFANIIYYALLLLRKRPEILDYVSAKFAWILVDEFQDTTDLQVEILALIAEAKRTRFLLVGDPFQSIFRFAGARPDLAEQFAKRIEARTDKHLSGNFRCSPPIVRHANLLFARAPTMVSVGKSKRYTQEPIWKHGASAFNVLTDYFLPAIEELDIPLGQSAILAPTWFSLFPLGRRLREYGVSIVGPGARPYRRNRQFAPLAEQACGYLMESRPEAIPSIERTLFNTLLDVTGHAFFDIYSYEGRKVVFRLLGHARELHHPQIGAVAWLEAAARTFAETLVEAGYLTPASRNVFPMSVEEMKSDMRNNKVDLDNLTIEDLGVYASPEAALKLVTLHNSKGREYEAVAMIDLHEGRIPFYQAQSAEDLAEAKRLFYVGVTRAKRFLMYVTDSANSRNQPTRFLKTGSDTGVAP
ncbi:ATP-dependent helicase [Mesorhizobium sp. M2A.F.Ca.ET.042.01.1.1]|uniref:UvrD-helicase domain-containing protein n=1 Tax=Mesorhizobium sp. M2A.F.Ca.ET.042.01.1.1 TaxID=2496745 RepID=UPI000FCBB2DC|nr:ATP-dependent helicase [Mesorhizobium sp. M2A.F.Ca.ET.042.01.1.1]RUX20756.1 ATP-dependent helicase [Mesorhizobium sp. M2A.F.Ca.ET.042.01.1.1]